MKLLNLLQTIITKDNANIIYEGFNIILKLINPMTPHIAHCLWTDLGFPGNVIDGPWPQVDSTALHHANIDIMIQLNGKLRGKLTVPTTTDNEQIKQLALENPTVQRLITDKVITRVIVVPGKLVNIVFSE